MCNVGIKVWDSRRQRHHLHFSLLTPSQSRLVTHSRVFNLFSSFFASLSNPIHKDRLMMDQLSHYLDNILFTFLHHYGYITSFVKTLFEFLR